MDMKKIIIGSGIAALAIVAGIIVTRKIVVKKVVKKMSSISGISIKDAEAKIQELNKILKAMRKKGASKEEIESKVLEFYETFENQAAS
jgi:methylmalonyl-CoA mutase cobalamin-binding subunit